MSSLQVSNFPWKNWSEKMTQKSDALISSLISENVRIGAELKRMTERAEMLSGEHDAIIRDMVLDAVIESLDDIPPYPSDLGDMVLKSDVEELVNSDRVRNLLKQETKEE
jgi:hypothetical protein